MNKDKQPEKEPKQVEVTISDRLDEYLQKRNFELEYSDDRMELFKDLENKDSEKDMGEDLLRDLDSDSVIIKYLSLPSYINNQIKKKKDKLSETDPILRKLDSIAYYILKSEFRNKEHKEKFESDTTGKVLNNALENNLAYKNDRSIKESDRIYGYPTMSVYAMNRNRSDAFPRDQKEVFILNEFQKRTGKHYNSVTEGDATDFVSDKNKVKYELTNFNLYDRVIYSLKTPNNVLEYFRYEQDILAGIDGNTNSEFYLISHVLEDIFIELEFREIDYYIVSCLRDGKTYAEVTNLLNEKYMEGFTFGKVRYMIETLLRMVSENVESKIKSVI